MLSPFAKPLMLQHQRFFVCSYARQVQFLQAPKFGFEIVDLVGELVNLGLDACDEALLGCGVGGFLGAQVPAAIALVGKVGFLFFNQGGEFRDAGGLLRLRSWGGTPFIIRPIVSHFFP